MIRPPTRRSERKMNQISGGQDERAVSTRRLSLCLHIFAYRDSTAEKETEPGKSLIDRLPLEMPCRAAAIAASSSF